MLTVAAFVSLLLNIVGSPDVWPHRFDDVVKLSLGLHLVVSHPWVQLCRQ